VFLVSLNDFPGRWTVIRKHAARASGTGCHYCATKPTTNIAYLYYFRGEYSRAIEMLFATRRACEVSGDAFISLSANSTFRDLPRAELERRSAEMAHEGFLAF